MSDQTPLLEENFAQVKILMAEERYLDAIALLNKLLQLDPSNKKGLKLLAKVREKWDEKKRDIVKNSLKEVDILWQQHRYEELYKIYDHLNDFYQGYKDTEEGLEKLKKIFNIKREEEKKIYLNKGWGELKELWKKKEYKRFFKACNEILEVEPSHAKTLELEDKARQEFVKEKIKHQELFLKHHDYQSLLNFYEILLKIAPGYALLQKLIIKYQNILHQERIKEKEKEIEYKLEKIKILADEGKTEQAVLKCQILHQLYPENRKIKKMFHLMEKKDNALIEKDLLGNMINAHEQIKKDYLQNKSGYIRL